MEGFIVATITLSYSDSKLILYGISVYNISRINNLLLSRRMVGFRIIKRMIFSLVQKWIRLVQNMLCYLK